MTTEPTGTDALVSPDMQTLHEVAETLAPLDRTPCSPGERAAAEWIANRLSEAGCSDVVMENEPSWGTFQPTLIGLGLTGLAGGLLALAGRRRAGTALMATGTLGTIDEAQNGPRIFRRTLRRRRTTVNVLAKTGDVGAKHLLVIMGHHDAAQTGVIFDQTLVKKAHERFPEYVERQKTSLPQWWLGIAAPLFGIAGALTRRRGLSGTGLALGALGTYLVTDMHRSPTVPGANDNLSAVAALVAVAEMVERRPVKGVEIWLVSCGAEETLQDGIRAFMTRHGHELKKRKASALNLDTVGSTNLAMLEGEGPIWMEDYPGSQFRDMIAGVAEREGIALERGLRARSSTDSVITARHGMPSTCLVSLTDFRTLANYHLPTDTPENLDYGTVAEAALVAYRTAEEYGKL